MNKIEPRGLASVVSEIMAHNREVINRINERSGKDQKMLCPKCNTQLTSLYLCPECGIRYDDLFIAVDNWYHKRRALLAVAPGLRGERLYGEFDEAERLLDVATERFLGIQSNG